MRLKLCDLTLLLVFTSTLNIRFLKNIEGVPSFELMELVAYVILLVIFANFAIDPPLTINRIRGAYGENRGVFWYFGWTGFASSIGGLLGSTDALRAFKDLIPCFVLYLLILICARDVKEYRAVLFSYYLGAVVNALLGVSQGVIGGPYPVPPNEGTAFKMDAEGNFVTNVATGLFTHPNALAIFMMPIGIYVIAALLFRLYQGPFTLLLLVSMFPVFIFAMIATYAKGPIAWTLLGLALFLLPNFLKRWRFSIAICAVISGVVMMVFLGIEMYEAGNQSLGTIVGRVQLWDEALSVLAENPLVLTIGNGFGAMKSASTLHSNFEYPNAHNAFLNQAIFYGLPALILYLWILISTFKRLSKFLTLATGVQRGIGLFLYSALVALSGEYFFEPASEGVVLQSQFFLIIALSVAISRRQNLEGLGR